MPACLRACVWCACVYARVCGSSRCRRASSARPSSTDTKLDANHEMIGETIGTPHNGNILTMPMLRLAHEHHVDKMWEPGVWV